ncbi:hypothetical protein AK972_2987 [Pseudomonas yamanorum]|nr:hypothetical protein AK972_2987 [Pseudomonas yamanorum]
MLFAFEHLGRTKLVKTDRAGHRKPRQSNLYCHELYLGFRSKTTGRR